MFSIRPSDETVRRHRASGVWRDRTVVDDVLRWSRETPDAPAVFAFREQTGLITLTYRELAKWSERFAAALGEVGVGVGDVVCVQLPNWWQALALELACWRRNAVLAPLMPTIRAREMERMLARLRASVFVTTDRREGYEHAAAVAEMSARLPDLRYRVVLGDTVKHDEIDFVEFFQTRTRSAPPDDVTPDPDDVALVLSTSGTTGEPKAVLHSLNTVHGQVAHLLPIHGDGPKLSYFTSQSLMNAGAISAATRSLVTGGPILFTERWHAGRVATLLAETGVEHVAMAVPFFAELLRAVREAGVGLPKLHDVRVGGSRIPPALVTESLEVLGSPLVATWGMTEGGMMNTRPENSPDCAGHSIGHPGIGTETELVPTDPDHSPSPEHPGRLRIRGGGVCLATIGRDTGTPYVLADHDDGWFDTGDLAVHSDQCGYRLVGRASDRIGGAAMIPIADVEDALRAHPAIRDVAIVGHRADTEGCAVVVSDKPVDLSEVHSYLSDLGMTEWYWPTRVHRVEALPRNQWGKVEKARLRTWLADHSETSHSETD